MKIISFIIIFLAGLQISCSKQSKSDFLSNTTFVKGEILNIDCLIGRPNRLASHDTLLFIYDPFESEIMTVLDVRDNH